MVRVQQKGEITMPLFLRFCGIDSRSAAGAAGGVWRTTNFLTTEGYGLAAPGRPGIGALRSMDGGSTWATAALQLSRVSLVNGVGGIDSRDPRPLSKATEIFGAVKRQGA